MGVRRLIQKHEKILTKYKWLIIAIGIIAGLFLVFFGAKLILLLNFLLGNDIIVKLDADTTHVALTRGETAALDFSTSVITNPFCQATCQATWNDRSEGIVLNKRTFTLQPGTPHDHTYTIEATRRGEGQEMYQYTLECKSKQTTFCHTDEQPTRRTILVTMEYGLNKEDTNAKQQVQKQLYSIVTQLETRETLIVEAEAYTELLEGSFLLAQHPQPQQISFSTQRSLWEDSKYIELRETLPQLESELTTSITAEQAHVNKLHNIVITYNDDIIQLADAVTRLVRASSNITNSTAEAILQNALISYDGVVQALQRQTESDEKHARVIGIIDTINDAIDDAEQIQEEDSLRLALHIDILSDAICTNGGQCISHDNLTIRVTTTPDTYTTCARLNHTSTGNTSTAAQEFVQNITNAYADAIPENETYSDLLQTILVQKPANLTNVTLNELKTLAPPPCTFSAVLVTNEILQPLQPPITPPTNISFDLERQEPTCCVDGNCMTCCESCTGNYTPVIFLHGHAFNKDTLAEYSLDGFYQLQKALENDGYIDAGSISLYTLLDTPRDIWGRARTPVSVGASYYLDFFREPENYVVVQSKSENINTYAIRLQELITALQYKTGKDEVIIVAHSMGGLVARRYAQLFGTDDLKTLILIGTPNHGINGSVAEYCGLLGEKLECRDMHADSLFMNKLQQAPPLDIPIHTIVGTGCLMDDDDGDGVVLVSSAKLEDATNHILEGSCTTLEPLHTSMLDISIYPSVYEIVRDVLASS